MHHKEILLKSDEWMLEEDRAWFVPTQANILMEVYMQQKKIHALSKISGENFWGFRRFSQCVKYNDLIYCLPAWSNKIQCYDLGKKMWKEMKLNNSSQSPLAMQILKKEGSKVSVLLKREKQIWQVNLESMMTEAVYGIACDEKAGFTDSVVINKKVYLLSKSVPRIYVFDLNTTQESMYDLAGVEDNLKKICFDGSRFWISGCRKRIYIWEERENTVHELDGFPAGFGVYNFNSGSAQIQEDFDSCQNIIFGSLLYMNDKIWMIPASGSHILYCHKDDWNIKFFEIPDEEESLETLKYWYRGGVGIKYMLQYTRENRYMCIYSLKNRYFFEIDTLEMTYCNLEYELDAESVALLIPHSEFAEGLLQGLVYGQKVINAFPQNYYSAGNNGEKIWKLTNQD